jgi:hypothetical protein
VISGKLQSDGPLVATGKEKCYDLFKHKKKSKEYAGIAPGTKSSGAKF